jgi:hypothetical protein
LGKYYPSAADADTNTNTDSIANANSDSISFTDSFAIGDICISYRDTQCKCHAVARWIGRSAGDAK